MPSEITAAQVIEAARDRWPSPQFADLMVRAWYHEDGKTNFHLCERNPHSPDGVWTLKRAPTLQQLLEEVAKHAQ